MRSEDFYTPKEAAALIGVIPETMWRMLRNGIGKKFKAKRLNGRHWSIPRKAFRQWAGLED